MRLPALVFISINYIIIISRENTGRRSLASVSPVVLQGGYGLFKTPKGTCLSLVLYGIRIGGFHALKESFICGHNKIFLCIKATPSRGYFCDELVVYVIRLLA